jgi:hypothetical protein
MKKLHPKLSLFTEVFIRSVFIIFYLTSCHSYVNITEVSDYKKMEGKPHVYVMRVQTNADSVIYFNDKYPGRMKDDEVVLPKLLKNSAFDSMKIINAKKTRYAYNNGIGYPMGEVYSYDSIRIIKTKRTLVAYQNGIDFPVEKITIRDNKNEFNYLERETYFFNLSDQANPIRIPFSDIRMMQIKQISAPKIIGTVLLSSGIGAGLFILVGLIAFSDIE